MTIFAPQTQRTQLSLDVPDGPTSYSTVTQLTPLSLEVSKSSDPSPVTDAASSRITYITVAPSPHLEQSGTYVILPDTDKIDASRAPKTPHLEITRTGPDGLPTPTEPSNTHDQGDSSSNPNTEVTEIGIVVPAQTSKPEDDSNSDAQDHQDQDHQQGSNTIGSSNDSPENAPRTFLMNNSPLIAGGSPVTVDGSTFSLAPTGSVVVVNGAKISFSTDKDGQAVPIGTITEGPDGAATDGAHVLGGLSAAPDEAAASETRSDQTSARATGDGDAQGTSTATGGNDNGVSDSEATGTNTESSPAMQSDNVGALNTLAWPLSAVVGAVGLLVAAI